MFVNWLALRLIVYLQFTYSILPYFCCIDCDIGFYGLPLKCEKCPYSSFGKDCQSKCNCTKESCNHVVGCIVLEYDTGINYCDIHQARSSGRGIHQLLKLTPWILRYDVEKNSRTIIIHYYGLIYWKLVLTPFHFKSRCCVPGNTTFVVGIVVVLNIQIIYPSL